MKRKALLALSGCSAKAFETYSSRGFLPFEIEEPVWSEYSLEDAFKLRLLMLAAQGTDLSSASEFARRALDRLRPFDPFAYTGGHEMWVAFVRYEWPTAPEDWDHWYVVAGRWEDLLPATKEFLTSLGPDAVLNSVQALSATKIAHHLLNEARDFGLPEAEPHAVPEDISDFPEWFREDEMGRRAMLFGMSRDAE